MAARAAPDDPWRAALRKVYSLWAEGDIAQAEEALDDVARRFPQVPRILLAQAQAILVRAGGFAFVADADVARGRRLVQQAIAPNESDVDTLVTAAVLACDFQDFDTAFRHLRHLRPLLGKGMRHLSDEDVAPYFNVLGRLALHRGDHELAEEFSRAAYDQDQKPPLVRRYIGPSAGRAGQDPSGPDLGPRRPSERPRQRRLARPRGSSRRRHDEHATAPLGRDRDGHQSGAH